MSPVVELILCQLGELVMVVVGVTVLDGGLLGGLDINSGSTLVVSTYLECSVF